MSDLIEIFITFFKIGLFSFGGGYAMIPMIREEVVINHAWLSQTELIDMVAVSQMTPGPIAVNIATYLGFTVSGVVGSIVATLAVTLPSFIIMTILFLMVKKLTGNRLMEYFFTGLKPIVVALIAAGTYSVLDSSILDLPTFLIACLSFYLVHIKELNPILVILIAGILGVAVYGV